jgi:hypothetical protein
VKTGYALFNFVQSLRGFASVQGACQVTIVVAHTCAFESLGQPIDKEGQLISFVRSLKNLFHLAAHFLATFAASPQPNDRLEASENKIVFADI